MATSKTRKSPRKPSGRDPNILDIIFEGIGTRGRRVVYTKIEGDEVTDSAVIEQERPFFRPRVADDALRYAEPAVFDFDMDTGDGVSIWYSRAGGSPRHIRSYVVTKARRLRKR